MIINSSVGRGGINRAEDVRLVQHLLNNTIGTTGGILLVVDGIAGPKTAAAIELYQRRNGLATDGRVDPTGRTLKSLIGNFWTSMVAGVTAPPMTRSSGIAPLPDEVIAAAFAESLSKLRSV